jgi:error-prone DNA polymerase
MLTCIRKCFNLIPDRKFALHTIPSEDPAVYDMICEADTIGVFQIESRAQMSMLPRLRPRNFYDLVIEVAIVRPGPIQGGMVHPYLRRRCGEEPVSYPSKALEEVLGKTLGVPLFQEQAMRLAVVAAGFTPGEADQLRRAMAAWKRHGSIDRFHERFLEGMRRNGYTPQFAEQCFNQIRGFGEYGFPESHAASFALLVYVSAWLKRYYPAAFAAALLNSQPMGFYAPAQIVRDAQNHGVAVLPPDVNESEYDCTLEAPTAQAESLCHTSAAGARIPPALDVCAGGCQGSRTRAGGNPFPRVAADANAPPPLTLSQREFERVKQQMNPRHSALPYGRGSDQSPALRLGFRLIKGISETRVAGVVAARKGGRFRSVADLARRSGIARATLARLAAADAFRSLGLGRREALWQALALDDEPDLFNDLELDEPRLELPRIELAERVIQDYDMLGLSLAAHPMALVREKLAALGVRTNDSLQNSLAGRRTAVSGLVLVRQRPGTANGIVFMTLEDETATANLIVRPNVWERYAGVARTSVALIAEGKIERQGAVVHVLVNRLSDVSQRLGPVHSRSRDFQ